jgi:hypothetical protein
MFHCHCRVLVIFGYSQMCFFRYYPYVIRYSLAYTPKDTSLKTLIAFNGPRGEIDCNTIPS